LRFARGSLAYGPSVITRGNCVHSLSLAYN